MKYICLGYYDRSKHEAMTEAEKQAMFDTCFTYYDHLRANGHWVGGELLQPAETALTLYWKNGKVATTDGPYAETKEQLGGILVLEARDMNHAHQLMSQHPALKYGTTIFEIRPAGDLNEILQAHGIQYEEVDDFPDTVDALIIERGRETYAAVNGRQHIHRRRFSLAHELGHFFLHRGDYNSEPLVTIDDPPSEEDLVPTKDPAESEADLFAGGLLVPLAMLKPHARKGVAELARIFLVSEHVISVAISRHYNVLFK